MTSPAPKRQKQVRKVLASIFADASHSRIIHYSCESFYSLPGGRSPRITSIAIRNLATAQTESFSIHREAEAQGILFSAMEAEYDNLEKKMLSSFYKFLRTQDNVKFIHWNMTNDVFGFQAIDYRACVLGLKNIFKIPDHQKFDLSAALFDMYGDNYIDRKGLGRLTNLITLNEMQPLHYLPGGQEATAFQEKRYADSHYSTLAKVSAIADLARLTHERKLLTQATWWQINGGSFKGFFDWMAENKYIAFLIGVGSLILSVWSVRG